MLQNLNDGILGHKFKVQNSTVLNENRLKTSKSRSRQNLPSNLPKCSLSANTRYSVVDEEGGNFRESDQ